jgi:hypothetical protein
MGDLHCAVCSEPWDAYGVHHGDMMAWEARLFKAGAGCPSCLGVDPADTTDSDRDKRQLQAAESASNNWDDPDSFPLVLDMFASAVGAKIPARRPWIEPKQRVLWTCAGCEVQAVMALRFSLSEENAKDLRTEWKGGKRVHYSYGSARAYGDHPNADNWPDDTAPHTIDGKPYCSLCAQTCDGDACKASIFQRKELEGDSYDAGSAFNLEGDYTDAYCVACFERLDSEQRDEERRQARIDAARDAWRSKEHGKTNAQIRESIRQALRHHE